MEKILGIETSCDETGMAIIEAWGGLRAPRFRVLKNLVASQVKLHRPYGGVVPMLAKREHQKNLPVLWKKLEIRKEKLSDIDLIAVTVGPGLEPALWAGITFAQELAKKYGKPLVGANHLEGHLYSFLLPSKQQTKSYKLKARSLFPAVSLIVSGGHTILLLVESLTKWKKLGETRDDAVGEAFDKVARLLGLPYPGGPELEKLARRGNPQAINFPRPMMYTKDYNFSFSGLKTAVFYYIRDANPRIHANAANKANVAASFQRAAVDVLVHKTIRAAELFRAKSVMLSGGVAANKLLRSELKNATRKLGVKFFVPDFIYNTDNAVMMAAAGYMALLRQGYGGQAHLRGKKYKLEAQGNLSI